MSTPTLERWISLHGAAVWGLCRRLCDDPEDAWQDAWARVLAASPRFSPDGPASARTWVLTITHRMLIDRHRRFKARGAQLCADDLAEPGPDALQVHLSAERTRRLEAAIASLPPDQQRVILFHHQHQLPLEQIALNEGVALGTVKSRLHRARARLAVLLAEEGP